MKTFSVGEAQSLLPVLDPLLRHAIEAKGKAEGFEEELQKISQHIFFTGGVLINTVEVAGKRESFRKAVEEAKDAIEEIEAIGVQVKDLDAGLLDFPYLLGSEVVLLCWKLGESAIAYWHTQEAGFKGRQPLDDRFLKESPEKPN